MKRQGLIAAVAIVSVSVYGLRDGGRAEAGQPSGDARSGDDVLVRIALRGLAYDHYKVRSSALGVIHQLEVTPPAARPLLIAILTNKEERSALRTWAARLLLKLGRDVVPDILELSEAGDGASLRHVFLAFERPSRGARDVLLELLRSRDASLRAKAYRAMGTLGGEALPLLAVVLQGADLAGKPRPGASRPASDGAIEVGAIRSFGDVDLGPEALPVLVAALSHANVYVRRGAAAVISRIEPKTDETVSALVKLTKDADPRVRITAIRACLQAGTGPAAPVGAVADILLPRGHEAASPSWKDKIDAAKLLGEIGPPAREALPILLGILNEKPTHSDTRLKGAVLAALPKLGPETMDYVLPLLGDTNAELRRAAAAALAEYGPEAQVPATPLFALLKDKDSTIRRHAACALAKARGVPSDAITVLSKAMKAERDHETLEALGGALSRMGRPGRAALLDILKCRNHLARWKASRALGELGIDVFDDLAATLEPTCGASKGQAGPKSYYRLVAGAMSMMGTEVVPRVKGWLQAKDPYKRRVAVAVLSTISPEGIDLLRPLFKIRRENSDAYDLLEDNLWRPGLDLSRMIPLYLDLATDHDGEVSLSAAARLSALTWKEGGAEAVPALVGLLRDRDPKVREHIVTALGKIREGRDISNPALIRRMRDLVPAVRQAACQSLKYQGDRRVSEAMVKALFRERDPKLRRRIAWCFARKDWAIPGLLEIIRGPDAKRRGTAAAALRSVGPLAVVALLELFESEDPELREIAVDGLKAMGDLAAPALIEMIEGL
ncbi:MAG: HEAT repeat domain-containing protein [Planctomycetota bacterium]|jgi:HEAT repeat protein